MTNPLDYNDSTIYVQSQRSLNRYIRIFEHAISNIVITKYLLKFDRCRSTAPRNVEMKKINIKRHRYVFTYWYGISPYKGAISYQTGIIGIITCRKNSSMLR